MNIHVLKKQKELLHLTNEEIASEVGVTIGTFYRWLNGSIKKIPEDKLIKLAKVLHVSVQALKQENEHLVKPILGKIRAGYDFYANQDILGFEEVNQLEALKGDYYLKVTGDSMIGERIFDGDLVYVKQVDDVNSGTIAVVLIGEEVTLKKVIKKDNLLILESANPSYPNRYFNQDEITTLPVRIIGQIRHIKRTIY